MKFIAIFLFILPGFLFAQKRTIKILDKETNLPVTYATVKVLHTVQGGITSEKGEVELTINKGDSLLISAVSYRRMVFTGDAIQDRIYLDPLPKLLSETIVWSKKEIRTVILGNGAALFDKNIKCDWRPDDAIWDCAPWGLTGKSEFAERIDLPDTSFFGILKVYIPLRKPRCPSSLVLRIYLADIGGYPGEEILTKQVQFDKQEFRKGKIVIDISAEKIIFQRASSFFVSAGWSQDACMPGVFLFRSEQANTFSRSLSSDNFNWHPSVIMKSLTGPIYRMNTAYAVELAELK